MTSNPPRTFDESALGDHSRRTILQALAATGSVAAFGGIATAQDDHEANDEEDVLDGIPVAGDFPEGETVGLQKVAEGLPAPTDFDYAESNGAVHHFIVTQTGQIYRLDPDEADGVGNDDEDADEDDELENDADEDDEDADNDGLEDGEAETDGDVEDEETDEDAENAEDEPQEFVFNGVIPAWFGMEPEEIDGVENPTLELVAGETYTFTWENGDDQPHNVVILDGAGELLERTEIVQEAGETQSLEFEATEEMDRYVCEVHPGTMVGRIQVVDPDEEEEPVEDADAATPDDMDLFLDIEDRIVPLGIGQLGDYDERGLLGVAFHPEFAENGRFYVRYSAPERDGLGYNHTDVLAEFQADDGLTVDPDTERTLMEIPQPQDNHNGGRLAFGPDGYLYVSIGDGGNVHDIGVGHVEDWYDENEGGNAQDTTENLLGGIIRIDVDEADDAEFGEYGIPEDNPLVDSEEDLDEYWAWGFRNPWGMSIDDDGQVFVSDAGQHAVESVYAVEEGGNYSWNVKEGSFCFSPDSPLEAPEECPDEVGEGAGEARVGEPLRDPIAEYQHMRVSEAFIDSSVVVGGHRYAGEAIPELENAFVFGNWSSEGVAVPDGEVLAATDPNADTMDDDENADGADDNDVDDSENADNNADDLNDDGDDNDVDDDANDDDVNDNDDLVEVDERWELTELQFEGADDESLNRYVYGVERDEEGDLYVLTNTDFRPFPETGEVYRIVPAGEGEEVPEPDDVYTIDEDDVEEDPEAEFPEGEDEEEEETDVDNDQETT